KPLCAGRPARRFERRLYALPRQGIPGLKSEAGFGTCRGVVRHREIRSCLGYSSRAETACREEIWQEIVTRRGRSRQQIASGTCSQREMLPCQRRRSGFAFLMLTTRADSGNSIGFGGRRW